MKTRSERAERASTRERLQDGEPPRRHFAPNKSPPLLLIGLLVAVCVRPAEGGGGGQTNSLLASSATQYPSLQRCSNGAPLQWRPYLDAASKAHLAPGVVLASLQHLNLAPIQLAGGLAHQQQLAHQQLVYHPQNINNVGVTIEATFVVASVLKKSAQMGQLKPLQTVKLLYKVSASLSTTSALMTLANSNSQPSSGSNSSDSAGGEQNSILNQSQPPVQLKQQLMQRPRASEPAPCAFELSEHDLVRKVDKIFKLNQNYVLFLDQTAGAALAPQRPAAGHQQAHRASQGRQQVAAGGHQPAVSLHPFASHEPLSNETSRALAKILCKGCGKFQWAR